MEDPVMLQSGVTFNREEIEAHFRLQRERFERLTEEPDSDFDEANFFKCPVTMGTVDPAILIENKRIKDACGAFLDANPWAFEFDPRLPFKNIKIWNE